MSFTLMAVSNTSPENHQPTRRTRRTRRQSAYPNPFHRIACVEYVRSVGCNWGYLPPSMAPFAPDLAKGPPRESRGGLYKGATLLHVV